MKVALLGAPGAGKTKLARSVIRKLHGWGAVDGYTEKLARRTGVPLGVDTHVHYSSFRYNLQVITARWNMEDELAQRGLNTITCGSLYESVIYSAIPHVFIHQFIQDEGLILEMTQAARTYMDALGSLERQTFDYDALFYLPLKEKTDTWNDVVDDKLREVLDGFFRYAVILDGTDRQKVAHATEIIQAIAQASAPPEDEQSTV